MKLKTLTYFELDDRLNVAFQFHGGSVIHFVVDFYVLRERNGPEIGGVERRVQPIWEFWYVWQCRRHPDYLDLQAFISEKQIMDLKNYVIQLLSQTNMMEK